MIRVPTKQLIRPCMNQLIKPLTLIPLPSFSIMSKRWFINQSSSNKRSSSSSTTKRDVPSFRNIILMALVGTIIATAINIIFLNSTSFDLILSIIFILIFIGLTAYDVQHVKELSESGVDNDDAAINGAFELYLDFINIFLHLIQIIGDAKD